MLPAAPSPFVYPELEGGIQRRIASQQRLMEYMQEKRRDVQVLPCPVA